MHKLKISLLTLLLLIPIGLSAQNNRIVIDTGHSRSIAAMEYHEGSNNLITADESGLIKVWNLENDNLEYQIDTGLEGSLSIKVHPSKTEVAILISRPGYSGLSVWNWKTGRNLFTKTLSNRPVQFDYSGSGKFLFIVQVGTPSVILYDSLSGREYSYLKRLNGLFSFSYIGSNETTIMTYSNSGYFRYYDIRTSSLQNESSTIEDLKEITVLQTEGKRYVIASKEENLYLIDRLSGEVRDTLSADTMISFSVDQKNGVISVIKESETGRLIVSHTSTTSARFTPLSTGDYLNNSKQVIGGINDDTGYFRMTDSFRGILSVKNRVFISDSGGTIWQINEENLKPEIFKNDIVSAIHDLSFDQDNLYMLTENDMITMNSEFFNTSGINNLKRMNDLNIKFTKNPLPGESFLEGYDEGKLLIWSSENKGLGYVLYDPNTDTVLSRNNEYKSSLKQLSVRENQVLALESSGEASISNIHTGIREFDFSALGMVSLNFVDNSLLLAGKSLMKTGRDPLFTVQTSTGEILPIIDNRFLIHNIFSPEKGNVVYSVGLMLSNDGSIETQIRSHLKSNPSVIKTLYSRDGEWINSILTVDSSSYTPTLYASITGRDIVRLRGSQKKIWDYDRNIENMFFHGSILYIINSDGSLTLFDPQKGSKIVDYYMLNDNNWIAISSNDTIKPYISQRSVASSINSFSRSTGRKVSTQYQIVNTNNDRDEN
ncbi:WD40 repeat domain-containing protein [Oceanispirochaeta crateris]|uniref:WD40 repeat domain-containing protein n=1 Tax=Oceanispirochaeta crateris TaxID=2518645 RepID=A0A5C1QJX5_9SPIO|nr:WD40 repeat domain-containing protein [Oceanispirochaeta crateris]QEN07628.1 WD40 repeat domain-containing protein [Oceanispirochaeta crateris]